MKEEAIETIREFNRFYTPIIGILDANYLNTGYSLIENRILFEIKTNSNISAKYLCDVLHLDKGYMSRILSKLEKKELLYKKRSEEDGRTYYLYLTDKGINLANKVIDYSNDLILNMIKDLSEEECRQICVAMNLIQDKLKGA